MGYPAQAAKWSRENASVLVDTHWIGGDPTSLQVYGWASWSKDKAILAYATRRISRNVTTDLTKDFEIPAGERSQFTLKAVYGSNSTVPEV